MEAGRTEGTQYVTVGEAAKLLQVHRNTIHNRIKSGRITAHKVVEGDREVYRIELDSLGVGRTSAPGHTLDAHRTTATEELSRMIATRLDEIVRDYTVQLGDLREELGAERARREIEKQGREIAEQRATIAEARAADLEAKLGNLEPTADPNYEEPPFEEPPEVRRPWWRRLFG
jgi:excisionase family DNA binding protein